MKTGVEMEKNARDIEPEQAGFPSNLPAPQFTIQVIRPGSGMVGVQLEDGRCGYIPESQVENFRRDNPEATVLL